MEDEKLVRSQSLSQDEVIFEQWKQLLVTESSDSEHEKDKAIALRDQLEKQKALAKAINEIRRELDLEVIFKTTTKEVCHLLEADRVAVYRFTPNWFGEFVAEFVTPGWVKLVVPEIKKVWEDTYLQETQGGRYRNNETFTVDDIYKAGHRPCHIELLEQFQTRAYVIVPIKIGDQLWGLLAAYQNSRPRHWQSIEVNLLVQIGEQFGVAVQQVEILTAMQEEITERQRAETALRQTEQKYRSIFENAVEGIFQTTSDGHYLNANPALAESLGYASSEELIEKLTDIERQLYVEPNRRTEFVRLMQKDKLVSEFESQVYRQDGRVIWISENARAVYSTNETLLYYEGFVEDITERKQAAADIRNALEKEKELNELKSHFVTMTSHEFRTPLATILSSADILQKYSHKLREEQKLTHLQQIQTTVKHMTQLLNDLLLVGKAAAGKLQFEPTPLDLISLCQALVKELELINNTHAIAFVNKGDCTTACMDAKLLRHILGNLLSNAIKYSASGSIVHFELICQQGEVIFHIQDEGIGIPALDQAQMFEPFHRASNVGTISGTGLGLAIVKTSVDLHGGTIIVASEAGVGTTFRVTIPLDNRIGIKD